MNDVVAIPGGSGAKSFSVTLPAARIGWGWLAGMTVVGASNLFLAFMLEMEIADKA